MIKWSVAFWDWCLGEVINEWITWNVFQWGVILYDSIIQNGGWVGEYKTLNLLKPIGFYKTKDELFIYEGLLKII